MSLLDDIRNTIDELRKAIVDRIGDRLNSIDDAIESVPNALANLVDKIADFADSVGDRIGERLSDTVDKIADFVSETTRNITGKIGDLVQSVVDGAKDVKDKITEKIANFTDAVRELGEKITEHIQGGITSLVNKISDFRDTISEKIEQTLTSLGTAIQSAWSTATERIKSFLNDLLERLVTAMETVLKYSFDTLVWLNEKALPVICDIGKNTKSGLETRWSGIQDIWKGTFNADTGLISQGIEKLIKIETFTDLTSFLIATSFLTAVLPSVFGAYAAPVLSLAAQRANEKLPVQTLPVSLAVQAVYRNIISQPTYAKELAHQGIDATKANIILETNRPLPSPGVIQEAFLRGFISETQHDAMLMKHGYTREDIALFKSLYYIIPSPADIIRMAVREAFTTEIAERFGQYEDLPDAFVSWAAKQGISKEWAERYWAAHWDLPSATMGFEMLHRGIIDKNELQLLLRALDVMPFWREKIIKLSYEPFTRVDVRRMFQVGILDYDGVVKAYKELGYDDEKARNLADFTVRYYTPEDKTEIDNYRELTRSIYINAYKKGIISREKAKEYLIGIGYRDEDAELLLSIADAEIYVSEAREDAIPKRNDTTKRILEAYKRGLYDRTECFSLLSDLLYTEDEIEYYLSLTDYELELSIKSEYLDMVKELYITRTIDKPEAIGLLGKLFISSRETESLFSLWDIGREMRTRKPTEAQFRAALMRGLISKNEYENELRGLGFAEKYVKMLSELATK